MSYWRDGKPLPVSDNSSRRFSLAIKRAIDIAASLLALIFLGPLLLFVALAIKMSDGGPVLSTQPRIGLGGRSFHIVKFRSLYRRYSEDAVEQIADDDPRVMPLGKFIRRTSIDELPQLFNVLRGDMSLVGPRPRVAGPFATGLAHETAIPCYNYRYEMRPGLTGWAQANGLREPVGAPARARFRFEHDVAYIQNYSLALDIQIILNTLRREFLGT